jgi:hypothetical protein
MMEPGGFDLRRDPTFDVLLMHLDEVLELILVQV